MSRRLKRASSVYKTMKTKLGRLDNMQKSSKTSGICSMTGQQQIADSRCSHSDSEKIGSYCKARRILGSLRTVLCGLGKRSGSDGDVHGQLASLTLDDHPSPPKTIAQSPHSNIAERVFAVPELFENIFHPLLVDNMNKSHYDSSLHALRLIRCRTVSKSFKANIDNSSLLQDLMFFNTINPRARTLQFSSCISATEFHFPGSSGLNRVFSQHGVNEILWNWDRARLAQSVSTTSPGVRFFETAASVKADEQEAKWVFEGLEMGPGLVNGAGCDDPASTFYTRVMVRFGKYRMGSCSRSRSIKPQHVLPPGTYLNMRFADPSCELTLVAAISEGGVWCNGPPRQVLGELKDGTTFAEVLDWLDLWEAREEGQSDLVRNLRP